MTAPRRNAADSPFNDWIRNERQLDSNEIKISVTDSDLWIHRYSERNERRRENATDIRQIHDCIMLVEIKAFCKKVPFAQRDTLQVVDFLLRKASVKNNRRIPVKVPDVRRPGAFRYVRCFGVHVLELDNDRPDNSETIIWDHKTYLHQQRLVEILRFDYDPDHPTKILDTRRHHRIKPRATQGGLDLSK